MKKKKTSKSKPKTSKSKSSKTKTSKSKVLKRKSSKRKSSRKNPDPKIAYSRKGPWIICNTCSSLGESLFDIKHDINCPNYEPAFPKLNKSDRESSWSSRIKNPFY